MGSVEMFERDVLDCGVPIGDVRALATRYVRALETGGYADWVELYVGTFATLLRRSNRTRIADASASRRMMLLIEDDLGSKIFDPEAVNQLAQALDGDAAFEYGGRARERA